MATYPIRQLADNGGTAQFVPVTAPEAVQFPDGSNLNTFIGSVATIESNPVAANHAVGEFLCINGQVYEVIDAITAGDSISLGENIQVTNLGSQITELNKGLTAQEIAITLNTSVWNANNTKCYRIGNLVILNFYVQGTPSNSKTIATGCPRPTTSLSTSAGSPASVVALGTNGTLYIQSAGTGTYIGMCLAYLTSD